MQDSVGLPRWLSRLHHIVKVLRQTKVSLPSSVFAFVLRSFPTYHQNQTTSECNPSTIMVLNKKKERQTHILDDAAAIKLAQQQGQRRGQPEKKQKNTAGSAASAHQNGGSSKSTPGKKGPAAQNAAARFYQKNGVKIALVEKSGKKKPHARSSQGLRNKNLEQLLDIVEEYAGAWKKQEFKKDDKTKADIADWIETVETHALGPNPKSKLTSK